MVPCSSTMVLSRHIGQRVCALPYMPRQPNLVAPDFPVEELIVGILKNDLYA